MSDLTPLKRCTRCGKDYPSTLGFFGADKRNQNGLQARCRVCVRINNALYAKEHPEAVRDCRKKHHQKYKARENAASRHYQKQHSEATQIRKKRWYQENIDRARENARRWGRNHPQQARARVSHWKKENPEKVRANHQRRRSRKYNAPTAFTSADWSRALSYFGGCCAVCGRPPGLWHSISQDHWIPLSRGGFHTAKNIVPLCNSLKDGEGGCNNSKHDADPVEWLTKRFGAHRAKIILVRIQGYFDSLGESE